MKSPSLSNGRAWRIFLSGTGLGLVWAIGAAGALITQRIDTDTGSPQVDGIISANEYGPGNSYSFTGGGIGFNGQLGASTLYLNSDFTRLYIGFSSLGIPSDDNQYIVYFHTRPGGFQPDGLEMNDGFSPFDAGRRNISILSSGGVERVIFENNSTNSPDFALFFNNRFTNNGGFQAFAQLAGAGNAHSILPRQWAGLGTTTPEFSVSLASLGVTNGGQIDLVAFDISGGPAQSAGYLSNEGLPNPGLVTNLAFAAGGTNIFADFHRFTTATFGPQSGLTSRQPNQTLQMPSDQGVVGYFTSNAFPGLSFSSPLAVLAPPEDTNRLFIVQQGGRIMVITNLAAPDLNTFMNLAGKVSSSYEEGLLSMAFHPGFKTNRYFYLWFTANTNSPDGTGRHDVLARYEVSPDNSNTGLLNTEVVLFKQKDDQPNHNGGQLIFGPDGYLYASLGDEGGANGDQNNTQYINADFFSAIIRIDVDKKAGSLGPNPHPAIDGPVTNYAIPPDNPFVGASQFNGSAYFSTTVVRTEFWAVGMRNPFRMSFDELNGDLYCGDVGQDNREEVDLIRKGGNYGWKWREGKMATPTVSGTPPPGFTNWIDPLLDYTRGTATNQGMIVIGGRVYRGTRFPELYGKYIFGDYASGNIWSLTHDGTNATSWTRLTGDFDIAAYGRDPRNGELLLADLAEGVIKRLERNAQATNNLPASLADTGVFYNRQSLTPYEGIVPYDLNVPFWSDNAIKTRWFSLPSTNLLIGFYPQTPWLFPTSMVWIKHFELELTNGDPSSRRRLETRILVRNQIGQSGYGVTYRWGTSTTNAYLVPEEGTNELIEIDNGGIIHTQVWHYPSRAECLICHQEGAGFSLGFNTPQLNRDFNYGNLTTNQIAALQQAGYFSGPVTNLSQLRKLAQATNTAYSVEYRARSYLQANCGQCHFPGGHGEGSWNARIFTPLSEAGLVNGALVNNLGEPLNRVIAPAALSNSVLLTRISTNSSLRMPPLASTVLDTQAIALVTAWINELSGYLSFSDWQLLHFGATNDPNAAAGADPDGDGGNNYLEWLTGTNPTNGVPDALGIGVSLAGSHPQVDFERIANRGLEVQYSTNLVNPAWQPLITPKNEPFFPATNSPDAISDLDSNAARKFYRLNVYEP